MLKVFPMHRLAFELVISDEVIITCSGWPADDHITVKAGPG